MHACKTYYGHKSKKLSEKLLVMVKEHTFANSLGRQMDVKWMSYEPLSIVDMLLMDPKWLSILTEDHPSIHV